MGEISDGALLRVLQRQMAIATAKAQASASNLANLNTPGYRTRQVTFSDALAEQLAQPSIVAATHAGHLSSTTSGSVATHEVSGLPARRDGNNVQLDLELLALSGASGEFKRVATAFEAKLRVLRYAINESR